MLNIELRLDKEFDSDLVIDLYKLNNWSSAEKPDKLIKALKNSDTLILAFNGEKMVGVAYAISDGHLVVYYPHMLIHPDFQGKGIGTIMMKRFQEIYKGFHMQMLVADGKAIDFYRKNGFEKAGETEAMWIYEGKEH